ncbi:MAG: hypothetical protein ACI89L_000646 [Phycisphaerales bacterium]|jgi:hypothetical protein
MANMNALGRLVVLATVIGSAAAQPAIDPPEAEPQPTDGYTVRQIGAMREVMREGHTQARFALDRLTDPGVVAVGALEGLAGEITVLDGKVWVTSFDGDTLSTSGPAPDGEASATLLALARVPRWSVTERIAEDATISDLVAGQVAASGLDTAGPFPFVLVPEFTSLELHVIRGYCPAGSTPEDADTVPWRWESERAKNVTIVGVYAPGQAGVMTHHGSDIHAHAILEIDGHRVTAHIDEAKLSGVVRVRLPDADESNAPGP